MDTKFFENEETIAAISTTLGTGGIAVLRISGSASHSCINNIFKTKKSVDMEERKLYYGDIIDPSNKQKIDSCLCVFMKSPNSYTGEDIAEIHCHGGYVVPKIILELIIKQGARPAEPGEFTKRAFLNGKMDLAQSEAVADIINAQTEKSLKLAESQLEGNLSKLINQLKNKILDNLAFIEAQVDFPEEDIDPIILNKLDQTSGTIINELKNLLKTYSTGRIIKDGINTVIIGKPNVGKSSILNTLLNKQRAIVSATPGTTRDFIEEIININGIPLKIIDTAGLRKTEDEIENVGIQLTHSKFSQAELILVIFDQSRKLDDDDMEIIKKIEGRKYLALLNKSDNKKQIEINELTKYIPESLIVRTSAKTGEGIENLKKRIYEIITDNEQILESSETILTNSRHKNSIEQSVKYLERFSELLKQGESPEILSIDLRTSMNHLGDITGEVTTEDILGKIFSKFCIGK